MAKLKRWNGSSWVLATTKRRSVSSWLISVVRYWTGFFWDMIGRPFIYNGGQMVVQFSIGYEYHNPTDYGDITFYNTGAELYLRCSSGNDHMQGLWVYTDNLINLTDYKTVRIVYSATWSASTSYAVGYQVGVNSSKSALYSGQAIYNSGYMNTSGTVTNVTVNLDVSALNGNYYVGFGGDMDDHHKSLTMSIHSIQLIPDIALPYIYNLGFEETFVTGGLNAVTEVDGTYGGNAYFTRNASSLTIYGGGTGGSSSWGTCTVSPLYTVDLTNVTTVRFNVSYTWTASSSYRAFIVLFAGSAQFFTGYMTSSGSVATTNIDLDVSSITGYQVISMKAGADKNHMNLTVNYVQLI
jgi:hypothetical protein